jgi:hypothetical protein
MLGEYAMNVLVVAAIIPNRGHLFSAPDLEPAEHSIPRASVDTDEKPVPTGTQPTLIDGVLLGLYDHVKRTLDNHHPHEKPRSNTVSTSDAGGVNRHGSKDQKRGPAQYGVNPVSPGAPKNVAKAFERTSIRSEIQDPGAQEIRADQAEHCPEDYVHRPALMPVSLSEWRVS